MSIIIITIPLVLLSMSTVALQRHNNNNNTVKRAGINVIRIMAIVRLTGCKMKQDCVYSFAEWGFISKCGCGAVRGNPLCAKERNENRRIAPLNNRWTNVCALIVDIKGNGWHEEHMYFFLVMDKDVVLFSKTKNLLEAIF